MKIKKKKCLPESAQMLDQAEQKCKEADAVCAAVWLLAILAVAVNTLVVLGVI